MKRSLMLAAVAAASFAAAGAPSADAGVRIKFGHHHHHGHDYRHRHHFSGHYSYGPRISIRIGKVRGCGYYYDKWQYTGSRYWKRKYKVCKGYW